MHKDASGRFFFYFTGLKDHGNSSSYRVFSARVGQLDSNKVLDSIVTQQKSILEMYDQTCEHFL